MISEYIIKTYNRILSIIKYIGWKILFGCKLSKGYNTFFYPGCKMMIERSGKIKIGNSCFFNYNCSFTSLGHIVIGNQCIFGENVKIYDHNHKCTFDGTPFRSQGYEIGSVEIGSNVWIGSNTIILPNVKIGDNVIIAAGSIITKCVESNSVLIQKRQSTVVKYE